jgi:hypothetical protein
VPNLRIIIDRLAGAKGPPPFDPTCELEICRVADVCPKLAMKFSSFYDMYAPGDVVYASTTDLAACEAHFDVLMTAFGADRLIWGSNWPVLTQHDTFEAQFGIGEEYRAASRHQLARESDVPQCADDLPAACAERSGALTPGIESAWQAMAHGHARQYRRCPAARAL